MKVKRLLALTLVFTLLGAATLFADTIYTNYNARKVAIKVNGTTINGLEVKIDSANGEMIPKTMVPLDELVRSIGGIVNTKGNEIDVYKPNVQLSLLQKDDWRAYGSFSKGVRYDLYLFAQIDSLYTTISSLKAEVIDPFGDEVTSIEQEVNQSQENFHNIFKPMSILFKYNGKYTVNLYMKENASKPYAKISQIVVESTTDSKK